MGKCTCWEDNRQPIEAAKAYGFKLAPSAYIKCRYCWDEQCRLEEHEVSMREEESARETFMAQPEHPDRWDAVFDFMYERGYRP